METSTPPRYDKALPDVAPIQIPDNRARSLETEAVRRKAWRGGQTWNGVALHPYSLGREELWMDLCEVDIPLRETWGMDLLEAAHAIKLLFLCATPAERLQVHDLGELVEKAEAWGDEYVSRRKTADAVALAKRIRRESTVTRARLKPSDRKAEAGNTAVPVAPASYLVMLAAATQGALSHHEMEWNISLARGWALIHGRWIYDGAPTLWTDKTASKTGAWMAAFRKNLEERQGSTRVDP